MSKLDGGISSEEDSGLHLRCDVDAFPSNVTFIWYHNDEPLPTEVGANLNFRHADQVTTSHEQMFFLCTVKHVYNDHQKETRIVVVIDM